MKTKASWATAVGERIVEQCEKENQTERAADTSAAALVALVEMKARDFLGAVAAAVEVAVDDFNAAVGSQILAADSESWSVVQVSRPFGDFVKVALHIVDEALPTIVVDSRLDGREARAIYDIVENSGELGVEAGGEAVGVKEFVRRVLEPWLSRADFRGEI